MGHTEGREDVGKEAEKSEADKAMRPDISPEVAYDQLTPEEEEQAKYWLEQTEKEIAAERREKKSPELAESEKMVSELKEIFDTWLVPEKLELLNALKSEAEAMASPERTEAKLALAEILKRIKALKKLLPGDAVDDLMDKFRVLSRAVGMINSGLCDHNR